MRSLTYKLTIAFLLVGLTGVLLISVILALRTRVAFNQFIANSQQQALIDNLEIYYQEHGSWKDVVQSLPSITSITGDPSHEALPLPQGNRIPFALIDISRTIIVGGPQEHIGEQLSKNDLAGAVALTVNNQTVGWVLFQPVRHQFPPNSPEASFFSTVNQAIFISAVVAVLLALLLGIFLAFTMTRSLRELTEATVEIAKGKLGRQVKVRSKDELGVLAESFNKMSMDLEHAVQARRQMTADIAHDLRSPLSVITGYAEALSDGKLPGTAEVYGILHQETLHLSRLVDDLRTLSLADAGELPLNLQPADPNSLLERIAARHQVSARKQGITLRVEPAPDSATVMVDIERMVQVMDNLVNNAFRYIQQGGEVSLSTKRVDGAVQIQVRDAGSGISPEDLPYIFDRFYRGDKARASAGESGLGLAIARSIVEAHGGTIAVESVPGQGASFTITLVQKSSSESAPAPAQ